MQIETVTAQTFERVLPLIACYQRFYKAEPDEARNRAHFGRLLDDHAAGIQFVALDEAGKALGFATLYFPLGSVTPGVACLMNDLFVAPEARGRGIGSALLEAAADYGKRAGALRLVLSTEVGNTAAQTVYERLGWRRNFAFCSYQLTL